MNELEDAIQMKDMVDKMADKVYQTLNKWLHDYYTWTPQQYHRTEQLLHSAVKVDAERAGKYIKACVYIDVDSLHYGIPGIKIVEWANSGLHGGYSAPGHEPHVWDDTINDTVTSGELLRLAAEYLRKQGLKVVIK